jgi:hypothetical protein
MSAVKIISFVDAPIVTKRTSPDKTEDNAKNVKERIAATLKSGNAIQKNGTEIIVKKIIKTLLPTITIKALVKNKHTMDKYPPDLDISRTAILQKTIDAVNKNAVTKNIIT